MKRILSHPEDTTPLTLVQMAEGLGSEGQTVGGEQARQIAGSLEWVLVRLYGETLSPRLNGSDTMCKLKNEHSEKMSKRQKGAAYTRVRFLAEVALPRAYEKWYNENSN